MSLSKSQASPEENPACETDQAANASSEEVQKLRLGVSSCLLGEEVRFDGGHKRDRFMLTTLGPYVEWFPVCPELEMGLGVPRESLRLEGDVEAPQLIAPRSGTDHTEGMLTWSQNQMDRLAALDLHGYIFKRASPSCGLFRIKVYGKKGIPRHDGRGLFAAELVRQFPLLPVEEEGRLHDAGLRENFFERLFAQERLKRFLRNNPTPGRLVHFHTTLKLTLMAHSPKHYRSIGQLVARAGEEPFPQLLEQYQQEFSEAMAQPCHSRAPCQRIAPHPRLPQEDLANGSQDGSGGTDRRLSSRSGAPHRARDLDQTPPAFSRSP